MDGCNDLSHIRLGPSQLPTEAEYAETMQRIVDAITTKEAQMSVRAKFLYKGYESGLINLLKPGKSITDPYAYTQQEQRTLKFSPVYSNGDPNHENTKFWQASPSGYIELGTVNPEAWSQFELGKEYYIDFTPAS